MKTCTTCKEPKEPAAFNKESARRDGLQSRCRACRALVRAKSCVGSAYYEANTERCRAATVKWRNANPSRCRINDHNHRARELSSDGKLTHGLAGKLFKLQKGKCACCGLPLGKDYHIDHKMPLSSNGANEDWNIQLLRQRCNNQKGTKDPITFMQQKGFLI